MDTKFLSPTNDFAFKRIFGSEDHKDLLISFLNEVLSLKGDQTIEQVDFLNPIQAPLAFDRKLSIVDILCKDARNIRYIVEMQISEIPGFDKRSQYYAAKAYVSQLERGRTYPKLNQVIFLAISNYILFDDKPSYKSDHLILDIKSHEHDLKDFSFTFIELPKFNKQEHELETIEDKWIYFLKHADQDREIPQIFKGTLIEEAYHTLERCTLSEAEMWAYEDAELAIGDSESIVESLQKKGLELLQKGLVEGMEKGLVEGMEKGMEKGKIEEKIEIAKNLLSQGINETIVATATDLTIEKVKQLKNTKQPT